MYLLVNNYGVVWNFIIFILFKVYYSEFLENIFFFKDIFKFIVKVYNMFFLVGGFLKRIDNLEELDMGSLVVNLCLFYWC